MNQGKNGVIPTQQKADQVDLLVQKSEIADTRNNGLTMEIADTPNNGQLTEIADTLKNGHTEIAETPNNGQNEEDLINEAIEVVITEELDAEANSVNGEIFMEAKEAVIQGPAPPKLVLDLPKPEKTIKDYIPPHYHEYFDVFMEKEAIDLPQHRSFDHHIKLIPDAPLLIPCRAYPLSQKEEEFQNKFIDNQLKASLICKMSSPYATPVFYIKKKNGSYRPIFDYWKINAIMVKDVFPLPRIDTIIEGARGKILFSVYDLCNGYWCLQNMEESENILAFKTTRSLYALLVMPFGPTNAPACMQRFMNHIFAPL
jgi:hypothetical protein